MDTLTPQETELAEIFQSRMDAMESSEQCAHGLFPEVAESALALGMCDATMEAIRSAYNTLGVAVTAGIVPAPEAAAQLDFYVEHALVTAVALGIAVGRSQGVDALDMVMSTGGDVDAALASLTGIPEGPEQYDRPGPEAA